MPTISGGCACTAIHYSCSGEPLFSLNCHCRDCQRESGSAFVPVLAVPKSAFSVTRGNPRYFTVTADSGHATTRAFCGDCGSALFGLPSSAPEIVTIRAGSLDDPSTFRPGTEGFRQTRRGPGISEGTSGTRQDRRRDDRPRRLRARVEMGNVGSTARQDQELRSAALPVSRVRGAEDSHGRWQRVRLSPRRRVPPYPRVTTPGWWEMSRRSWSIFRA